MHRDKRLGLALGVLLIAIVGAFFFRIQPTTHNALPQLVEQDRLDQAIAQMPIAPYLTGLEEDNAPIAQEKTRPHFHQNPPQWIKPEQSNDHFVSHSTTDNKIHLPEPIDKKTLESTFTVSLRNSKQSGTGDSDSQQQPSLQDESGIDSSIPSIDVFSEDYQADQYVEPPQTMFKVRPYRVRQGDTLSRVAEKYLGSSLQYMEIYRMNRDVLKSPDDLTVGMLIRVPLRKRVNSAVNNLGNGPETDQHIDTKDEVFETQPISVNTNSQLNSSKPLEAARPGTPSKIENNSSHRKHRLTIKGSKPISLNPEQKLPQEKQNIRRFEDGGAVIQEKTLLKQWPFKDQKS